MKAARRTPLAMRWAHPTSTSNRNSSLLESPLSYRKQRTVAPSNRNKSRLWRPESFHPDGSLCLSVSVADVSSLPISNRQIRILEPLVSHRKQTTAAPSNRQKSRFRRPAPFNRRRPLRLWVSVANLTKVEPPTTRVLASAFSAPRAGRSGTPIVSTRGPQGHRADAGAPFESAPHGFYGQCVVMLMQTHGTNSQAGLVRHVRRCIPARPFCLFRLRFSVFHFPTLSLECEP